MTPKTEVISKKLTKNLTCKITTKHKKTSKKAFTLLELLVVIAILGMLAGFVVPKIIDAKKSSERKLACTQMTQVAKTLDMFQMDNSAYPDTEEGLAALLANPDEEKYPLYPAKPYYDKMPKDSWKKPFIYIKTDDGFKLMSYAADRKEGGEDYDKDIIYPGCEG